MYLLTFVTLKIYIPAVKQQKSSGLSTKSVVHTLSINKNFTKNFLKVRRKTSVPELRFSKFAGIQPAILLNKKLGTDVFL